MKTTQEETTMPNTDSAKNTPNLEKARALLEQAIACLDQPGQAASAAWRVADALGLIAGNCRQHADLVDGVNAYTGRGFRLDDNTGLLNEVPAQVRG